MNPNDYTIVRHGDQMNKIIVTIGNWSETVSRAFAWKMRQEIQNLLVYCPEHGDQMLEHGVEDEYWCNRCYEVLQND